MARSKEATRKAILDATEALLMLRGAHTLTIDAVAREARCAKGLVHYHFRTKGQLLVEVVQQYCPTTRPSTTELVSVICR